MKEADDAIDPILSRDGSGCMRAWRRAAVASAGPDALDPATQLGHLLRQLLARLYELLPKRLSPELRVSVVLQLLRHAHHPGILQPLLRLSGLRRLLSKLHDHL